MNTKGYFTKSCIVLMIINSFFFQSQSNQKNLFNYKINVPRQNNGFDKAVYNKIIKVN